VKERDRSQNCRQLLADEVNTRASRSWRSKCLEQLAGIGTYVSVQQIVSFFAISAALG